MAFPNEISTPFLFEGGYLAAIGGGKGGSNTRETKDASVEKVSKIGNNLKEHSKAHYNIYASQSLAGDPTNKANTLSTLDLIYYHVYGDYRLTMLEEASSDAPSFLKQQGAVVRPSNVFRYISAPPQNVKSLKGATNGNFLKLYLDKEDANKDKIKGVLTEGLATEQSATEWFQRALAFGSAANKFHLPSLGTMAVSTMGVAATAKEIALAATRMIETLHIFIEENRGTGNVSLLNFLEDPMIGRYATQENDVSLIYHIAETLIDNLEYKELIRRFPSQIPDDSDIRKACEDSYAFGNGFDAAEAFIRQILNSTSLKFGLGMPVRVKAGKNTKDAATKSGLTEQEVTDAEWIVVGAEAVSGQKAGQGNFTIRAEIGGVEEIITDMTHSTLDIRLVTLDDETILESAGSKKRYLLDPVTLTFFRIFLDILFTFEAVIYAGNIKYQPRRIDNSINIGGSSPAGLGIASMRYPNMLHIFEDSPFLSEQIKDSPGAVETFSSLRATHTMANLANMDSFTSGYDIEKFYKEDLRLSEVLWLAGALTDEGKVIFERTEKPNLLAQLQYRIKGVGQGIDAEAPVNAKTVFYRMDSPILKDVIMKYDELFIAFTISNSYMPKDKKQKKKGSGSGSTTAPKQIGEEGIRIQELASAIWGSIQGRSSDIINREGVKPHLIFKSLFAQMENIAGGLYGVADLYPSQWTGTNTVTRVSRDPLELGEEIDMKFYAECMDQYIKHLKNNYGGQPPVAQAVLTILGDIVINAEDDIDTLRESFIARVKSQAKRPMLKGTDIRFDAYRAVMCVMRSEIDIPLQFRESFVAQQLDESQKEQLRKTFSSESKPLILPETHPEFKPEVKDEGDEESALFGLENPNDLPQPKFYPKPGSILNKAHPEVAKLLNDLIGPRGRDYFPKNSLFSLATQKWTPAQVKNVKRAMLEPDTTYTVMPIGWKGNTKIWDGRDNDQQPPNPSVVTHYRDNFGIIFSIDTPTFNPFKFDILAGDLTNYDTILYRKYTNDKFDTANYVYFPPDGVFKNPNLVVYSARHGKNRTEDPDFTSGDSFMIYRGEIAPQVKPLVDKSVEIDFEPVTEKLEQLDTRVWDLGNKTVDATDRNTAAITGAGKRIAAASEMTGESFEKAAKSFEAAGKEFSAAAVSYENSAQEFAKIPAALKTALVEAATEMVDNLELKLGKPIAEFDPEEDTSEGREAYESVEALSFIESNSGEDSDFMTEGRNAIANISAMLPKTKYLYRSFTKKLQDKFAKEGTADGFTDVEAKEHTGKSVRAWVASSLSVALVADTADKVTTDAQISNMSPLQLKAFKWRRHCVSVIQTLKSGEYAEARRLLGIGQELKE
jgi:hypothetical protein